MKLHEFHVAQFGTCSIRDRVSVRRGHRWIGRLAEQLPRAARAQNELFCPQDHFPVVLVPDEAPRVRSLWTRRSSI